MPVMPTSWCSTCFNSPAEPGSRVCADCGVAHTHARNGKVPPPRSADAQLAAAMETLRKHDAALMAQDDAL